MKKLIAILLAVCLVFALTPAAFAADAEEITAANVLNALGLFQGVGKDADGKPVYDLDRAPNRMEAVTMLVRLLGKEEEANAGTWEIPFTDVKDWAKPYVGYAYANGLTKGYSEKTFGGTDPVTATQYLTFALRALGYSSDSDFKWNAAWELSDQLGITAGEYDASTAAFDRGDVVKISYAALGVFVKGTGGTLGEKLLDEGVFTVQQYLDAMAAAGYEEEDEGQNPVMNWIGKYVYGRATATVTCEGTDSARIEIDWGSSYAERTVWVIVGKLDLDTLTISYTGAVKKNQVWDENGLVSEDVIYEDGTGTIRFSEGTSFTWHEDQSEYGDEDFTFEWVEIVPPAEEDGQNPVMNFIGEYQCDRAHAVVECEGTDSARIKIHWGSSAWDAAEWVIVGKLDLDTLTISYTGASKTIVTYDWDDEIESEEKVYEDGTGTIVFHDDGTFTWHEDQSEDGKDLVFKWGWTDPDEASGPVADVLGDYAAGDYEAKVMDLGDNFLYILIYQDISDLQYIEWCIMDELDPETMTVTYTYASKEIYTFEDEDDYKADVEEVYDEGTGAIVFNEDGTFTWHEDQSETGEDVVLAIVPKG